jgi:hypothetical protein
VFAVLTDLLTVVVLAWFGSRLLAAAGHAVRGEGRLRATAVCRGLRLRHFVLALPVLVCVVAAASALVLVPGLDFGWWTAIGGVGNPVVGATSRAEGSPLEWLVPALFVALLVPALPLLVEREERLFRWGAEDWSFGKRLWRGVVFGAVHAVIGIPVGVALALSIGGWYLTWSYLRGHRKGGPGAGLLESTRSHLAYNLVILALVATAAVTGTG